MGTDTRHETLADAVAALMYGVAGWLLVGLGLAATASAVLHAVGGHPDPLPIAALVVFAALSLVFGVMVNPRFRDRIARRRELSRFGRATTVDQRVVRPVEDHDEQCVTCGGRFDHGVVRRYREEYLLAGVPLVTASEGRNSYCADCAMAEMNTPMAETNAPDDGTVRGSEGTADDRRRESARNQKREGSR